MFEARALYKEARSKLLADDLEAEAAPEWGLKGTGYFSTRDAVAAKGRDSFPKPRLI